MLKRNERSLESYLKAGAEMRLYKAIITRLAIDISTVISAADQDRLLDTASKVARICSRAEDKMFADYPELSGEYLDVFYGPLNDSPRNDVDRQVVEMAREAADGLFERKTD